MALAASRKPTRRWQILGDNGGPVFGVNSMGQVFAMDLISAGLVDERAPCVGIYYKRARVLQRPTCSRS